MISPIWKVVIAQEIAHFALSEQKWIKSKSFIALTLVCCVTLALSLKWLFSPKPKEGE